MKKLYTAAILLVLFAACSDYEYDYSNLSDKSITFKVSDVSASAETEASVTGRASASEHVVINKAIQAAPNDYKPMYLQSYVEPSSSYTSPNRVLKDSRAAITTENLTSFGVLAYRYASGSSATIPNFLYNENVTKTGSKWLTSEQYNWPANSDKIDFYAYAPYNGTGISLSSSSTSGVPVIDFTMQQAAANQVDLVTAVATNKDKINSKSGVTFTFEHALTTIKFVKANDLLGTISNITLKNVFLSGKYTVGGSWNFTGKSATNYEPVLNTSLMMIPQTFGESTSLEVVYSDGINEYTLNYSLANVTWHAGETVTYRISSEELTTMNVEAIVFPSFHEKFPKQVYKNGDEVGLYVVDSGGNIKSSNVKLTYNGTSWTAASSVLFSPEYDYYAYYPYQTSGLGNSGNNSAKMMSRATDFTSGSATDFFAEGVSAFSPLQDQSSATAFNNSDLQIAKGYVSISDAISLKFDMTHALGLAHIKLGTKFVGNEYYLSTDNTYRWCTTPAVAASTFASDSYKPYAYETNYYYVWVKPNVATTIKSESSHTDAWTDALTFTVPANTLSPMQTAYSKRNQSGSSSSYTLQIGDYLYSDGSFAHPNNMPTAIEGRHPIAVVFSLTTSTIDTDAGYKSGYAVALATTGYRPVWAIEGSIGYNTQVQSSLLTTLDDAKADLDGRTETARILALSDFSKYNYPAAYKAVNFGTSEINLTQLAYGSDHQTEDAPKGGSVGFAAPTGITVKNSGWYLGSIGQYYLMAKNLGGNIDDPESTWNKTGSTAWWIADVAEANMQALNEKFAAGGSYWAPAFGIFMCSTEGSRYSTFYLSSSEYTAAKEFRVVWDANNRFCLAANFTKEYSNSASRGVRPVIAF